MNIDYEQLLKKYMKSVIDSQAGSYMSDEISNIDDISADELLALALIESDILSDN